MFPRQSCWLLGLDFTNDDSVPLDLNGGVVEVVEHFKYLGSLVVACGSVVGGSWL